MLGIDVLLEKNYREKDMSIPSLVIMANYIQFLGVGFASNVYRASSLQMGFSIH